MQIRNVLKSVVQSLRDRVIPYNAVTLHPIYRAELQNIASQLDDLVGRMVGPQPTGLPTAQTPSGQHETYLVELTLEELETVVTALEDLVVTARCLKADSLYERLHNAIRE